MALSLATTRGAFAQGTCIPQFADRIVGVQAGGHEGRPAFALDGSTMAIGASGFDTTLELNVGRVRLFAHDGTAWHLESTLEPAIAYPNAFFGSGVGFGGGDRLVVGAPGRSLPIPILPKAYVYERTPSGWTEAARLEGWDAAGADDMFGFSVAMSTSGDTIVVGSPHYGHSGYSDAGAAYVFERNPATNSWTQSQNLVTTPPGVGEVGWSVAIDAAGDTILVGAPVAGIYSPGESFVFNRTPGGWIEEARLIMSQGWFDAYSGYSVALDAQGEVAVVGAPYDNDLGMWSGAASVFRHTPVGWIEEAKLRASDGGSGDSFGISVAVSFSGDRIYCGSIGATTAGTRAGATYAFDLVGGSWIETSKLIVPNGAQGDGFGAAIGVTIDGSRVAIAASGDDALATDAGAVHILESPCASPETYCTAKQNSLGCWPVIRFSGHASAWDGASFELQAHRVLNQKLGWLVYSVSGRAALAFGGGTLCMNAPIRRTPIQSSGGSPPWDRDCSGSFAFDFNDWIASEVDPALHVGARVQAQYISRDPASSYGLSLTDAVELLIEP